MTTTSPREHIEVNEIDWSKVEVHCEGEIPEHIKKLHRFLTEEFSVCTPGVGAIKANKMMYVDIDKNSRDHMATVVQNFIQGKNKKSILICATSREMRSNNKAAHFFEKVKGSIYQFIERRKIRIKGGQLEIYRSDEKTHDSVFAFIIGPHFGQPHGRYAPTTAVVFTWVSETDRASQSEALLRQIRENVAALGGPEYEATPFVCAPKCPMHD